MAVTKTTERFKQDILEIVGNEYIVIGKYTGAKNKIPLLHKKCNQVFQVKPDDFLHSNRRCRCKNKPITLENHNNYTVLSTFNGYLNPITIQHNICHTEYTVKACDFMFSDVKCSYCEQHKSSNVEKLLFKHFGTRYLLLGQYIDDNTPVEIEDTRKNIIFFSTINELFEQSTSFIDNKRTKDLNYKINHKTYSLIPNENEIYANLLQNKLYKKYGLRYLVTQAQSHQNKVDLIDTKCNHAFTSNINQLLKNNHLVHICH